MLLREIKVSFRAYLQLVTYIINQKKQHLLLINITKASIERKGKHLKQNLVLLYLDARAYHN